MPVKRGLDKGKYYYQYGESGKIYFYITGNNRSRKIAKSKAMKQQTASHVDQSGGKIKKDNIPIWGGKLPVAKKLPIWGMQSYKQMHGGAAFWFNTQTPERMAEIQAKYKGQAHPDFIDQYADILNQPPKMMGWRNGVSRSEWYPEEKAAYLIDGSPISKREIIRIAGKNCNNMDELVQLRGKGISDRMYRPILTPIPKNVNVYSGKLGGQNG